MKKLAFLMTAAVALAACSSDDELLDNVGNGVPDKGEKVTVIATLPGGDTRVALQDVVDENGKNIIKVDWNESGERFTVMNATDVMVEEYETDYVFSQTEGDAFTGTLPTAVDGEPYYAFYPAIQLCREYEYDGEICEYYVGYYDENDEWIEIETFSPSCVPYDFETQDGTLNEVKFTLTGLPAGAKDPYITLSRYGEVRPSYGYLDLTMEDMYLKTSSFGSDIYIDAEGDVVGDDGTYSFYAYLPPVDKGQSMSISFWAQDEDYEYSCEASVEVTEVAIEGGKFYRVTRAVDVAAAPKSGQMTAGTVEELQAWVKANKVNGGRISLTLTGDIDLTNADLDGDPDNESNWIPFVLYEGTTIDGAGHTITGMKVHTEEEAGGNSRASIFLEISSGAVVKNIHLRDVDFYTKNYIAAGFTDQNYGSIIGCSVTGSMENKADGYPVAGIAGYNGGSIIACWSTAELTGGYETYGITGGNSNSSTVEACYWSGETTGGEEQAGEEVDGTTVTWESAASAMNEALPEDFGKYYKANGDNPPEMFPKTEFIPL